MKKIFSLIIAVAILAPQFIVVAQSPTTTVRPDTGDIVQFNNLVVSSVSGTTVPAEIVATPEKSSVRCLRFNESSGASQSIACPAPASGTETSYRIQIETDTILLLKNRARATLADFATGDIINVYGFYNQDGTIRGLVVRDLSKPIEKTFVQLENLEVIGILSQSPLVLAVVHAPTFPCYSFQTGAKSIYPCPLGLKSLDESPRARGLTVPESVRPNLIALRKYEIKFNANTATHDRNRKVILPTAIEIGDKLNIYGSYLGSDAYEIEADIVRDLSKPNEVIDTGAYDGIITQINNGDGTFYMRRRDGTIFTVDNPVLIGNFLSIKGKVDEVFKTITNVTQVNVQKLTDTTAIPVVSRISPGIGTPGTQAVLTGTGFTPNGNNINFAGVRNAITNLSSFDGLTLAFTIPSTPCSPGTICAQIIILGGDYKISVTNANGTSNEISFQVLPAIPLVIQTKTLPQVVQNTSYNGIIAAVGGVDSYSWSVTGGSLPMGLTLNSPICITYPCQVSANIYGIPTTPGNYNFTVTLKSGNESISQNYSIVVVQALNAAY
jgi:hypothetical protein